jgi:hypothetical protein
LALVVWSAAKSGRKKEEEEEKKEHLKISLFTGSQALKSSPPTCPPLDMYHPSR